ncbi:MAG: RNA polymerase sigma factor [Alphaproteobacteria bacterium]|nr:RNA polymerase sigma factor [Alphaproteobacteria bacterium]
MSESDRVTGRGADEAFRRQIVDLLPRLRRFARGLTGSPQDADDLVQNACVRAIERAHQYTDGTRLDSWMYRIMHNRWLDEIRARKVRAVDDGADLDRIVADDGVARVEANLTLDAVRRLVARLPEDQRAVLLLVCVEGLAYKDAAETLGIPIGTVMSRLARARGALARQAGVGREGGAQVVKLGGAP